VLSAVRVRAELARYQITVAMFALTAAVGAAQFAYPGVVDALQRDPDRLRAGQWWRAITSMFVQPSGLGQYAFNLLGIAVVGIAAQQICRPSHWLTVYLLGGLAGNLAMSLWFPHTLDGGSSDAVAALIGVVAVMAYSAQRPAWWPSYFYAAFFTAYLAGLAAGGVVAGVVAGNAAIVLVSVLRRATRPAVQVRVVLGLVLAAALLMTALRDSHGPGLLTGALAGLLLARWRRAHDRMAVPEPARG
jgi:membrane associated rhomboid family serine protease